MNEWTKETEKWGIDGDDDDDNQSVKDTDYGDWGTGKTIFFYQKENQHPAAIAISAYRSFVILNNK